MVPVEDTWYQVWFWNCSGVTAAVLLDVYMGQAYAGTEAAALAQRGNNSSSNISSSGGGRRQEHGGPVLRSQSSTKEHQGTRTHHPRRGGRCKVTTVRSDRKIMKLRAELEEAEQARKDELVKKAKNKEARDKEAEVKEAKDRGGEGATGGAGEATRQWRVGTIRRSRATNKLRVTAAYFHPRRDGISQYRSGRSN